MQSPVVNWNMRRQPPAYTRYKDNMHWNQNFRPRGQYQNNIQNCDYQHWCETCDKGFATAHLLDNHKLQHQKCSIDGCQFVAHPKIITKHIQMQHSTGLFKKIAKLNNPEDIQKWREERKRKYPTIENIKKKQAASQEKIKRGEKMGMGSDSRKRNEFHHRTNQRSLQTDRTKHVQGKFNRNVENNRKRIATNEPKNSQLPKKICKAPVILEERRTLKPFTGIASLSIDEDLDKEFDLETQSSVPIEDDEDEVVNASDLVHKETSVSESTVCSALTSLMCCYESDDDLETSTLCKEIKKPFGEKICDKKDNKIRIPDTKINASETANCEEKLSTNMDKNPQVSEANVSNCGNVSDDESGPEEVQISKQGTTLPIDNTKIFKTKPTKEFLDKKVSRRSANTNEFRRRKLPSSLLQKLLRKEIQHERNVILQCVRYVVKNNYFENS